MDVKVYFPLGLAGGSTGVGGIGDTGIGPNAGEGEAESQGESGKHSFKYKGEGQESQGGRSSNPYKDQVRPL